MTPDDSVQPGRPDDELTELLWERIREHLEQERERIRQEISAYPPPIPACDSQFNHLLAERDRITRALAELKEPPLGPPPEAVAHRRRPPA